MGNGSAGEVNPAEARDGIGMTSMRTRRRLIERLRANGIQSESVLAAMEATPRHLFVGEAMAHKAYEDTALPIGHNQTISQPWVVARMTELLLEGDETPKKVLEVGTGTGYQTAVLTELMEQVYTIERIEALHSRAHERLSALGAANVRLRLGDGYRGWRNEAPFDGIMVTAAPREVPEALTEQLAIGGRLVVPVGGDSEQELRIIDRTPDGLVSETIEYVRFVPLLKGVQPADIR